jgi:hypothetical protein
VYQERRFGSCEDGHKIGYIIGYKEMIGRSGHNPCGHQFAYVDRVRGADIIRCCTCDWFKVIKGRPARKTDMPYKEFVRRKVEFNG